MTCPVQGISLWTGPWSGSLQWWVHYCLDSGVTSKISWLYLEEDPNVREFCVWLWLPLQLSFLPCFRMSLIALNLKSSPYLPGSGITSGTDISPSSIFTTSDIVGLSDGDALVHKTATLTTFSTSSRFALGFRLSSISSVKLCSFWQACHIKQENIDLKRILSNV